MQTFTLHSASACRVTFSGPMIVLLLVATLGAQATQNPPPSATPAQVELATRLIAATGDEERRALIDPLVADSAVAVRRLLAARAVDLRRAARFDEAANAYAAARRLAEKTGDRSALGLLLVNWSAIPGQQADYPASLKLLTEALAIGEELHDDSVTGAALANLAIIHRLTGDFDRAIETNLRALELAGKANDRHTQGRVY